MALMVRKNPSAQSSRFVETMNRLSAEQAVANASSVDDSEINFDDFGPSHDEDDGPPLEPDEYEPPYEIPMPKPSTESLPLKKPLRKPAMPVKDVSEPEVPPIAPALVTTKSKKISTSEQCRLYCDLSRRHHRRLKIASLMTGKSVAALLEGWIDEHCPSLPEP